MVILQPPCKVVNLVVSMVIIFVKHRMEKPKELVVHLNLEQLVTLVLLIPRCAQDMLVRKCKIILGKYCT